MLFQNRYLLTAISVGLEINMEDILKLSFGRSLITSISVFFPLFLWVCSRVLFWVEVHENPICRIVHSYNTIARRCQSFDGFRKAQIRARLEDNLICYF